ncbi:hypothetical protein [Deinococcus pimensis]|uniref:hypothetical protein n=1 Tax=Deinococcus pimensis TaxID=309888 RepID=UPI00048729A8|nr:hypothetical protein [Deinococcus pimensis]
MRKNEPIGVALGLLVLSSGGYAHNAGLVRLPNGNCVTVGSEKSGPEVPESNPHRNTLGPADDLGRLDLIPESRGDQYGPRFAATRGNSAVEPPNPNVTCTQGDGSATGQEAKEQRVP